MPGAAVRYRELKRVLARNLKPFPSNAEFRVGGTTLFYARQLAITGFSSVTRVGTAVSDGMKTKANDNGPPTVVGSCDS